MCCNQFLLYSCILSKTGVIFTSFAVSMFVLYFVHVLPAVFLLYLISAVVILLAYLALMVQFSLLYNKAERASVLCSFILVFFNIFCGLNIVFIMPVIFI